MLAPISLLPFRNQDRLKAALTISGGVGFDFAILVLDCFVALAVSPVGVALTF